MYFGEPGKDLKIEVPLREALSAKDRFRMVSLR